jgi:hypothetical protein
MGRAAQQLPMVLRPTIISMGAPLIPGGFALATGIGLWSGLPSWWMLWLALVVAGIVFTVRALIRRVVLTESYVRHYGVFRNRTVLRAAVREIDDGLIFWVDDRGRTRALTLWAFTDDVDAKLSRSRERWKSAKKEIARWVASAVSARNRVWKAIAPSTVDKDFDERWLRAWPHIEPFDGEKPSARWVRIYSGAQSTYFKSRRERAEAFRRHVAVLRRLIDSDADTSLIVIVDLYQSAGEPVPDWVQVVAPNARPWRIGVAQQDPEPATDRSLWIDESIPDVHALDRYLRLVVASKAGQVIIANASMTWRYQADQLGADVIAVSTAEREVLRTEFGDWLTSTPPEY